MIVLPKEDSNRQISLEKQLEKLNNMKSVLASSHSTINLDYAMNQIINQIKITSQNCFIMLNYMLLKLLNH